MAAANVEVYPTCRFYVVIGNDKTAVFTEVSGLQMETEPMEYQEGGNNTFTYRLPGHTKVSNLTLKHGMASSNGFFEWYKDIAQGRITRRHVTVTMYDVAGNALRSWDFNNAYPVKWIGPTFNASEAAMAIETLELAHEGMKLG
jgi:phage tail-like protein